MTDVGWNDYELWESNKVAFRDFIDPSKIISTTVPIPRLFTYKWIISFVSFSENLKEINQTFSCYYSIRKRTLF